MPSFDTTDVASRVNTQPLDIGKTLGGFADLQNSLNQNKMFQANARAGQYIAQATGPDGKIDFSQLTPALQDPVVGPAVLAALKGSQDIQGQSIINQQNQTSLNSAWLTNARQAAAVGGTTSKNPDKSIATQENLVNAARSVAQARDAGAISPEVAAQFLGSPDFANTVRASIISGAGGTGSQQALTGTPTQVNLGGSVKTVNVNPYTNSVGDMGGDAATLSTTRTPEGKAALQPLIDSATNQPKAIPSGALTDQYGNPIPNKSGLTGPSGEITTGLVPGQQAFQESTSKNLADQQNALQTAASTSAQRVALLKELKAAHTAFKAGPGSSGWSDAVTETNRLFGTNFSPSTPQQQVFNKLATSYAALMRPTAGLLPTDEQQQISQISNPNTNLSDEAIDELVAQGLGNEDRWQVMNNTWGKLQNRIQTEKGHTPTPQNYGDFQSEFNSNVDPRYFQEKYMTDQQKQQMMKSMSPAEIKRYQAGKSRAQTAGFLP